MLCVVRTPMTLLISRVSLMVGRLAGKLLTSGGRIVTGTTPVVRSHETCRTLQLAHVITITVEPLNNGHIGTDHFVHYREVVLFQEVKMHCHYIGWCIGKCPLYRGVLYSECPLPEVGCILVATKGNVDTSASQRAVTPLYIGIVQVGQHCSHTFGKSVFPREYATYRHRGSQRRLPPARSQREISVPGGRPSYDAVCQL